MTRSTRAKSAAVPAIVERAITLCYPPRGDARERARRAFLSLCPSERRERVASLVEAFADWRADGNGTETKPRQSPRQSPNHMETSSARSVANNARAERFDGPSREHPPVSTARLRARSRRADSLVAGAPRPADNGGSAATPFHNHRPATPHTVRVGANKRRGRG